MLPWQFLLVGIRRDSLDPCMLQKKIKLAACGFTSPQLWLHLKRQRLFSMNGGSDSTSSPVFLRENCVTISSVGAISTLKTMALLAALLCALPLKAQTNANCHGDPALERRITQMPSADSLNALGVYFTHHKSSSCGETAFKRALEIDPHYWQASLNLGLSYLSDGQNVLAARQLRTAETEKPDSLEVHNALGTALEALGKKQEAQAQFDSALTLDPRSDFAWFHRGLALEAEGRLTAAIDSYHRALEIIPANIDYSCALANAEVMSGDANKGIATLQALTGTHPDSALLWYNSGR